MSRFDERTAVGMDRVLEQAGTTVTISRRGDITKNVPAIVGNTRTEVQDGEAQITERQRDYLIDRTAYVLGGFSTEPKVGDRLEEEVEGAVKRFEVWPLTPGTSPWSWSDRNRKRFRIHTREIDAVE